MSLKNLDEVAILQKYIVDLDQELSRQKDENRIRFMCAALSSTPANANPELAADRAYNIAIHCMRIIQ